MLHSVKIVSIQSYSGPHFPVFGLNTKIYRVSVRIQSGCRKIRTIITPNRNTFHAVLTALKQTFSRNFVIHFTAKFMSQPLSVAPN